MDVIIFANGPRLEQALRQKPPVAGLTLAVNNAINRIRGTVDWYCGGDVEAYAPNFTKKKPRRGWCIISETFANQVPSPWHQLRHITWPEIPPLQKAHPITFSITAAYALALHLGASRITTYGEDRIDEPGVYDWNRRIIEEATIAQVLDGTNIPVERVTWTPPQ